jgi:hypothetical protein
LEWGGHAWQRRSPQNKFGSAIWYSRAVGKDESGVHYARLITFREMGDAEPLPAKVADKIGGARKAAHSPAAAPPSPNGDTRPEPTAPEPIYLAPDLPTDEQSFAEWQARMNITGRAIYNAIGSNIKGWFKLNAGRGYDDLAQTLITTLGLGEQEPA